MNDKKKPKKKTKEELLFELSEIRKFVEEFEKRLTINRRKMRKWWMM